jgi:hypothetical protein
MADSDREISNNEHLRGLRMNLRPDLHGFGVPAGARGMSAILPQQGTSQFLLCGSERRPTDLGTMRPPLAASDVIANGHEHD